MVSSSCVTAGAHRLYKIIHLFIYFIIIAPPTLLVHGWPALHANVAALGSSQSS